jgi:ADP-heptose:LPS heptosyltransferase
MFDVRLMRWIDDHVGNLACSVLANAKRVSSTFTSNVPPRREDVKKICVTKFFGMGSIVVASPSLMALREVYPNAEIHFVSFRGNKEILEILGLTDKNWFVDVSTPAAFVRSTTELARDLRAQKFDLIIDLEFFAKFPLVLARVAGIPRKAGFYLTKEPWRRTLLDVAGSYNHYFHTKDIFLSLVYLLKTNDLYYLEFEEFRQRFTYPRIEPGQAVRKRVSRLLSSRGLRNERVVVINPNTSPDLAPEVRKWPEERYADVARRLIDEQGVFVAFVGANSERQYVERIVGAVGRARAISLAGDLSLSELLALLAEADLFISNDSGPMHLACLVDVPIVGLFFADTPTVFAPLASRTAAIAPALYSIPLFTVYNGKDVVAGLPIDKIQNTAARTISVDRVHEAARRLLGAELREVASFH